MHQAGLSVAIALGLGLAPSAGTQNEGHERADEHIEKIERASEEMKDVRKHLNEAFEAYHKTLREGTDERRSSYKDLVKALERCEEETKELRKRHREMDEQAEEYFKKWKNSVKDIKNADLERRSEERLEATRRRYREVSMRWKTMGEDYEPVLAELRDQVVYLGHDLNEDAVLSLKEDAAELEELARALFRSMEGFGSTADEYIGGLESN
jgi:hypothetical protein